MKLSSHYIILNIYTMKYTLCIDCVLCVCVCARAHVSVLLLLL